MTAGDLITRDQQIEFRGLLLGSTTPYGWQTLEGWDQTITVGNKPRNSGDGSYPGNGRRPERAIVWAFQMHPAAAEFTAAVAALEQMAATVRDATEHPLVIADRTATRMVYAKCTRLVMPRDKLFAAGIVKCGLQWVASNPAKLELTERSVTIAAPTAGSGGLTYPLTYPLVYGTAGSPNNANATNFGTEPADPVLTFTGPLTTPRVVNSTLTRALEFNITLGAGQTLTVDVGRGTVLLDGVTDRLTSRTNSSVPVRAFQFGPGDNNLTLLAASFGVGAQLTATWRSTY
ncbi:hypothetical protein AB0J28_00690 [Streptosporangium canum]|uniref:phage distal tail protein n=1 Tax=Streptosporangium canum TaxID=324952 RepID=UPI0034217A4C